MTRTFRRALRSAGLIGATTLCALGTQAAIARAAPITEFSDGVGTNASSLTVGSDGNIWFIDQLSGGQWAIARITPSGQVTQFTAGLLPGSAPHAIEAGPGGDLWFTDEGTTKAIGQVTPAGQITEFPAGTHGLAATAVPDEITDGPGGALFFLDFGPPHQIGEITPQGTITEDFFSNDINDTLNEIADGPDGNVYFTVKSTPALGKLDVATGVTSKTLIAAPMSVPNDLTAGPDGNLWFDDDGTSSISKLDVATGTITTFDHTNGLQSGAQPDAMTDGPDGNVWFIDQLATQDAVGRVTPAGVVNEFPLPGTPWGITTGIDGNLWVSVGDVNEIARVSPAGTLTRIHDGINAGANITDGSDIIVGPDGNLWTIDRGLPAAIVRADVQLPPLATTAAAPTTIGTTTATVGGTVNPRGNAATATIQYGPSSALGSTAAAGSVALSNAAAAVSGSLTGLTPGTTYFYRVVGTNAYGTGAGPAHSFTTAKVAGSPPPPKRSGATSKSVTVGDQRVTVSARVAHNACVAVGGSLKVSITAAHVSGKHLTFGRAALFLDRGVAHKRHRTIKGKRRTITVHVADAVVHHLPGDRSLPLRHAKSGTHHVRVRLNYTHTVRRHGQRRTLTTHKTVTLRFRVC